MNLCKQCYYDSRGHRFKESIVSKKNPTDLLISQTKAQKIFSFESNRIHFRFDHAPNIERSFPFSRSNFFPNKFSEFRSFSRRLSISLASKRVKNSLYFIRETVKQFAIILEEKAQSLLRLTNSELIK